jgi:hypothetical protein
MWLKAKFQENKWENACYKYLKHFFYKYMLPQNYNWTRWPQIIFQNHKKCDSSQPFALSNTHTAQESLEEFWFRKHTIYRESHWRNGRARLQCERFELRQGQGFSCALYKVFNQSVDFRYAHYFKQLINHSFNCAWHHYSILHNKVTV